ncbi:MAG TPA: glutathione peroxidase [Planctomycetota bacterium]|nr:glutathione peroxidase [Planctomycetota bacterium]
MRSIAYIALAVSVALVAPAFAQEKKKKELPLPADSLYKLQTKSLDGKPADLKEYSGKVTLVVNVASQCGFTKQYTGLEKLYEELKDRNFVILAFPSNDFGGQEPGSPEEIQKFCSSKYSVTFPLFEKVVTKAGKEQSPIYANLQAQAKELPAWNFSKYLVAKNGKVVKFYKSAVAPDDAGLRGDIEAALKQ